jgi:hypothetical protein
LRGTAQYYPNRFVANIHLARLINSALGFLVVTPWDVDRLPAEDIEDIVQLAEKRRWIDETEKERKTLK